MNRPLAILLSVLALALVAGCGGDDSDSSDSGGGGEADKPAEPSGGSKAPAGKGDVTVTMKDIKFVPAAVSVKKGQTILWKNGDQVPHNVTKDDGPGADFKSATVDPGGTYTQKFDAPGKIAYLCTIHPNQTGSITVK
jgi:plastocyanin